MIIIDGISWSLFAHMTSVVSFDDKKGYCVFALLSNKSLFYNAVLFVWIKTEVPTYVYLLIVQIQYS